MDTLSNIRAGPSLSVALHCCIAGSFLWAITGLHFVHRHETACNSQGPAHYF